MLNYQDLYRGFLNIFENSKEYTENIDTVCQRWTNVFEKFYLNQMLPIPGSSNPNLYPSLQIFKNSLLGVIKSQTWNLQFEVLVQKLHLGVCTGVTMTGIYTTIPPNRPLILKHCWNCNYSSRIIANKLASNIFTWVQSTSSIQTSSGVTIKWM